MNDLYKRHNFTNPDISILHSIVITEYDMQEAGFSLCKQFNLLSDKIINNLNNRDKEYRKIYIGKLQKKDKAFVKSLTESFVEARRLFFDANELQYNDVISIKKDAIFVKCHCPKTKFGEYINFIEKNHYSSYIYLDKTRPKLEFYYNSNNLDVKGVNDEIIKPHNNYMIKFMMTLFNIIESGDQDRVLRFMKTFIDNYKLLKLDVGYYREFNGIGMIRLLNYGDENMLFNTYWEDKKEDIDIAYNYFKIIIPILKLLI